MENKSINNLIEREALKRDVRDVVFAVADTPLSNDAMSKLVFQMGELVCKKIDEAPGVDAEPVRHGFWKSDGNFLKCSECDRDFTMYDREGSVNAYYWCPNCGAKMHTERTEGER